MSKFDEIVALDGTVWSIAWGVDDHPDVASEVLGVPLKPKGRIGAVAFYEPRYGEEKTLSIYDCGAYLWAAAEITPGVYAQAVRPKNGKVVCSPEVPKPEPVERRIKVLKTMLVLIGAAIIYWILD
ncbi:hypothetical protein [Shimia sp. FJ5]|uniref:hypothetical protein n=1 Tax=Shimia sp. FJ5 TaxID=3079054 RepID=UPI0026395C5D|nr:hypothetical protein [Shimia sp. FJ5]MDV4146308.1 hypothetical protein [Shimia sp. FJ5]